MNRWSALALLLAVAGALVLRGMQLGARPLHGDEGMNATKLAALVERGEYKYDPHEFHGPSLYYAASLFFVGSSKLDSTDAHLRYVTVAFGVGLILLLLLLTDGLGKLATVCSAVFLAVSPAMIFYSRYFIHEMVLVFFTMLTLVAGWRYAKTHKASWAVLTGGGVGLMFATKETFVLSIIAMLMAAFATATWDRWRTNRLEVTGEIVNTRMIRRDLTFHAAIVVGAAMIVWFVLFSSFFTNWSGLADSFKTYTTWFGRAGGNSPHIHPWWFYMERLLWFHRPKGPVWTEGAILVLAVIGTMSAFSGNRTAIVNPALARFLAFYTLILTAIYSVISYKTPWCLLNFWLGAILLAGIGAAVLIKLCRNTVAWAFIVALLLAAVTHLAIQSWRASVTFAASPRNPYVYAHTSIHVRELIQRVEAIARVSPDGLATPVKIIAPESYWPLPWYLRDFSKAGWWDVLPSDPFAPIMLVSARLDAKLDDKSAKAYIMAEFYELRPNVFIELYVERRLWEKFVATLPKDRD
ncbi:MAG: TIGR03663 family protein [Verrucomicrobia bacterium]|nr:TIGR03663 family protein [Verrucomicrobiota bacterium]